MKVTWTVAALPFIENGESPHVWWGKAVRALDRCAYLFIPWPVYPFWYVRRYWQWLVFAPLRTLGFWRVEEGGYWLEGRWTWDWYNTLALAWDRKVWLYEEASADSTEPYELVFRNYIPPTRISGLYGRYVRASLWWRSVLTKFHRDTGSVA